jgi:hypothetical protein
MQHVVVFASGLDEANRRTLEDSMVRALAEHGVQGMTSYNLFPSQLPDREQAKAVIQRMNADGILVARFKGVREQQTFVPDTYGGTFYDGWYGYSGGYVQTEQIVNLETTLWDTRANDHIVWSALTKTTNPSGDQSGNPVIKSITGKVVGELAQERLIPPGPKKE